MFSNEVKVEWIVKGDRTNNLKAAYMSVSVCMCVRERKKQR